MPKQFLGKILNVCDGTTCFDKQDFTGVLEMASFFREIFTKSYINFIISKKIVKLWFG